MPYDVNDCEYKAAVWGQLSPEYDRHGQRVPDAYWVRGLVERQQTAQGA